MSFAEKLKEFRKKKDLKQGELGKAIGVSQVAISSWEQGTRIPRMETVVNIALQLECTLDDLEYTNAELKKVTKNEDGQAVARKEITESDAIWLYNELKGFQYLVEQKNKLLKADFDNVDIIIRSQYGNHISIETDRELIDSLLELFNKKIKEKLEFFNEHYAIL